MPLSNFPLPGVQNKQERHRVFENMNGFYSCRGTLDYYKPNDSTKKTQTYIWFSKKFIDPCKKHALYKCLQIQTKSEYDDLSNLATSPLLEDLYSMSIQGAVVEYNKKTNDYELIILDYSDKTRFDFKGSNEKCFHGSLSEFALNSKINLDLSGGFVGATKLRKMKRPLSDFKNKNFDTLYAKIYKAEYPENPN
jgi:hypothetical protein